MRKARKEAAEAARRLLEMAVSGAANDPVLAKRQAALARKITMRFNVKLDWPLKRFYCRGCKTLIVPGVNARVRLGGSSSRMIRITCKECGHVNRKVFRAKGHVV